MSLLTFDAGQTIIDLDLDFLAQRLDERGTQVAPAALAAAVPAAWRRYDALVDGNHGHPWRELMTTLLTGAGIADVAPLVEWLWTEQPRANLWRRPIPDMVALARELAAVHPVAVLSNSEGGLAALLREIGVADPFVEIFDSGRIGVEKPDRRIFDHALAATGETAGIHIGDSWSADVEGALGAGWRAIWYLGHTPPRTPRAEHPDVAVAHSVDEVRAALARWGVTAR